MDHTGPAFEVIMRPTLLLLFLGWLAWAPEAQAQDKTKHDKHPPIVKVHLAKDHEKVVYDLRKEEQRAEFMNKMLSNEVEELHLEHGPPDPMALTWDLGLWAIVIFVLLMFILRKAAWDPMLEGLRKREETIRSSVEEAKKARAETERITAEFKLKMEQAYAEIPRIMEEARRDADLLKEEMRAQTAKDIQTERARLRREIDTARDQALQELWNQAAQLATLISAKAIGRSLGEGDHRRLLDEAITELGQSTGR